MALTGDAARRACLEEVAAEVERLGRRAVAVPCDVTSVDEIESCVRAVEDALGRIDVLVNNAGGPIFNALVLELRDEGWQRLIDLNLTSVFRFCQRAGRGMVARGSGSVINVASVVANRPWPTLAAYTAAKTRCSASRRSSRSSGGRPAFGPTSSRRGGS
jgi:NAD(P)-dependent dehydrogenase (short-subunit alcohol dehydrogenase family)